MEAYKRIKSDAAQLCEPASRVLTPAIFEKTLLQPPSLLTLNKSGLSSADQAATSRAPVPGKSQNLAQFKSKTPAGQQRSNLSFREFDRNVCGDGASIQGRYYYEGAVVS